MNKAKYLKNISLLALLVMTILIFIGVMSSVTLLLGDKKADVTERHKYSLSNQSMDIAKNLDQHINITIYASKDLDSEYPELDLYRQNIMRLLSKYQMISGGKITINIKNPEPYSPAEYEAQSASIRSFPDSENTHNMYFGAVFSSSEGKQLKIPYFSLQRQNYLEYDISRILAKLNGEKKKNVGVVSFAGNISDWQIFNKIKEDYRVMFLNNKMPYIPENINTLLVYNPQQVSINFIYALDQYIMRGGNLILLMDPYAEVVAEKYPYTKKNRNLLLPLLKKWGISMSEQKVVADKNLSDDEYQTAISKLKNPTEIHLRAANMAIPDFLGEVSWPRVSFRSAGNLKIDALDSVEYTPIFFTTDQAQEVNADIVKYEDQDAVNNALSADYGKKELAYWLNGFFESYFEKNIADGTSLNEKMPAYLSGSLKPSQILIIADSDFLADSTWNLTGYQKGATVYDQIPSSNNADFILSAIDYMNKNDALASLRVNYLVNDEKNIAEQIYTQVFNSFAKEYNTKEQEIALLQKDLAEFKQQLNSRKIAMSLLKIQELDDYNRRQQKIVEDIKSLNYKIQQKSGQTITKIIVLNMFVIPLLILLLSFISVKLYIYRKKQNNKRIIHE